MVTSKAQHSRKRTHDDVIDLTEDGESDNRATKSHRPDSTQQSSPPSNSQASRYDNDRQGDELVESSQDSVTTEQYVHYGTQPSKVVGIRYYSGYAANRERVMLRRQPENQYDRNAIQVLNVNREQIGHIPRQLAAKLAKYLDNHELLVEGMLTGRPGEFDIPLNIYMFRTNQRPESDDLKDRMSRDRLDLSIQKKKDAEERRQRAAELKKVAKGKRPEEEKKTQYANGAISVGDPNKPGPDVEEFIEGAQVFNPREWGEVSEQYGAQEDAIKALSKASQPDTVATKLLHFQLQGLKWMLEKEDPVLPKAGSDEIVQLWKQPSKGLYTNIATNFSVKNTEPKLARGGILADDMGLGKTLQIISLIAADKAANGDVGPTLIVAPVSVMSNWSDQIARHVLDESALRVHVYHGAGRKDFLPKDFKQFDVVITTYGTLSVECMPKGSKNPPKLPTKRGLYSLQWRRIVLDEGHNIRNPSTKSAVAACAIDAYAKWALTGTPIINSLKDLYSLVKFIGLSGGLDQMVMFNSVLIRPLKDGQSDARLLLQALMGTVCLRRRKDMSFIDLKLPARNEYVHHVELSKSEQKKYNALEDEAKGVLTTYNSASNDRDGKKIQQTYRHLLEILLRLRQCCNDWKMCESRVLDLMSLPDKKGAISLTPENVKALQSLLQLSIESREECPVCMEDLHDPVITPCGHFFGLSCIQRVIETQHKCPMCRRQLKDETELVAPAIECGEDESDNDKDKDKDKDHVSAKTEALLQLVAAIHKDGNKTGNKIVIFSQWRRYLDIVEPLLLKVGYGVVRVDGSMPAQDRDKSLRRFDADPKATIMLA